MTMAGAEIQEPEYFPGRRSLAVRECGQHFFAKKEE
jgi:hypothetical protein